MSAHSTAAEEQPTCAATPDRHPTPYEACLPPAVRRWLMLTSRAPALERLIDEALSGSK